MNRCIFAKHKNDQIKLDFIKTDVILIEDCTRCDSFGHSRATEEIFLNQILHTEKKKKKKHIYSQHINKYEIRTYSSRVISKRRFKM